MCKQIFLKSKKIMSNQNQTPTGPNLNDSQKSSYLNVAATLTAAFTCCSNNREDTTIVTDNSVRAIEKSASQQSLDQPITLEEVLNENKP